MQIKISRPTKKIIKVAILAFLIQLAISSIAISQNPWTPFDEATHFDYVLKLSKGHLPSINEKYSQDVLAWMACNEPRAEAWKGLALCGSESFDNMTAPFYGQSSATGYPPHYYVMTAVPFEICDRSTSLSQITCARTANSMWLNSSAAAIVVLMMMFGASGALSLLIAVGYSSLPPILLQGVTVNSDAAAQFLAPLLIILAIKLSRSSLSTVQKGLSWAAALFLLVPIKQSLLPIAFIATLVLVDQETKNGFSRSNLKKLAFFTLSFFAATFLSLVVQMLQIPWRGLGGDDHMGPFLKQEWEVIPASLNQATNLTMFPFGQMVWTPFGDGRLVTIGALVALLGWISFFAVNTSTSIAKLLRDSVEPPRLKHTTITASFLIAVFGPVLLALALWVQYETAPVTSRYYMATAMTLGAIGISSTSNKSLRVLFGSLMAFSSVVTIRILLSI
jgi:hypothetical protein